MTVAEVTTQKVPDFEFIWCCRHTETAPDSLQPVMRAPDESVHGICTSVTSVQANKC